MLNAHPLYEQPSWMARVTGRIMACAKLAAVPGVVLYRRTAAQRFAQTALLAMTVLTAGITGAHAQSAQAQSRTPQAAASDSRDPIQTFIERNMPAGNAAGGGRIEISVGSLDPRLQLAPCQRIEPYLLPGTRLWGRTSIGVRCLEGATWTVSLPVTVTVRGPALVAAEPITAGSPATAVAVRIEEVELTRESGTPVTDPEQLMGKTFTRGVAVGQVLRLETLRATPTVVAGDPVRIDMVGKGFVIQSEGQALSAGAEGQPLRVRTESGRIVSGTLKGRAVEIRI
jgi:flagella basal body P-ring formation protein FlgA